MFRYERSRGTDALFHRIFFDSGYTAAIRENRACNGGSGYTANNREYALLLRHPRTATLVGVRIHGTEMGRGCTGSRSVPCLEIARRARSECRHARSSRCTARGPAACRRALVFPGEDVLDDVHATAQAVWDIRRLLSWIRSQEPESLIGLNSLSLGGYIASLVASLEKRPHLRDPRCPGGWTSSRLLGRHSGLGHDDPRRHTMELG